MQLSKEDCPHESQIPDSPYSHAVGSLMHAIVNSRPDIAYSVTNLAQYMSNPGEMHKQTLKRTVRYIKGTLSLGIKYQSTPNGGILHGFFDADWAGDKDTKCSTSGYSFLLAGGVISWGSKKQTMCSLIFHKP